MAMAFLIKEEPFLILQELQKSISCLAGFAQFYKQDFSDAKELFMSV